MDFMALRKRVESDLYTVLPLVAGEHGSILLQSQQFVDRIGPLASEGEREQLSDQAVRLEICQHTSAMVEAMNPECHLLDLLDQGGRSECFSG
jgi:hypothetical protein